MSWKKYFTPVSVDSQPGTYSPIGNGSSRPGPARANYSSYLPDVYTGAPNRVQRYLQYDTMDMDSEVNAALDILAEFCRGILAPKAAAVIPTTSLLNPAPTLLSSLQVSKPFSMPGATLL